MTMRNFMKHNRKHIESLKLQNRILWVFVYFCILGGLLYITQDSVLSPCSDTGCHVKVVEAEERLSDYQKIDRWVDIYSEKYGKTRYEINRLKALTHYLLLREQNYGGSSNCGDSGKACGPMQFHAGTYTKNRNDMIKKGLAKKLGSRENMENAIETAIYMFSIGQEKQWGPVLREEIKL